MQIQRGHGATLQQVLVQLPKRHFPTALRPQDLRSSHFFDGSWWCTISQLEIMGYYWDIYIYRYTYNHIYIYVYWLVVSTILKNISQWEGLSHILWKITNVPNHQPVCNIYIYICSAALPYLFRHYWILCVHHYIIIYCVCIFIYTFFAWDIQSAIWYLARCVHVGL